MGISFLFSFPLASLFFSAICKASSDNNFAFLHFFFLNRHLAGGTTAESGNAAGIPADTVPGRQGTGTEYGSAGKTS